MTSISSKGVPKGSKLGGVICDCAGSEAGLKMLKKYLKEELLFTAITSPTHRPLSTCADGRLPTGPLGFKKGNPCPARSKERAYDLPSPSGDLIWLQNGKLAVCVSFIAWRYGPCKEPVEININWCKKGGLQALRASHCVETPGIRPLTPGPKKWALSSSNSMASMIEWLVFVRLQRHRLILSL